MAPIEKSTGTENVYVKLLLNLNVVFSLFCACNMSAVFQNSQVHHHRNLHPPTEDTAPEMPEIAQFAVTSTSITHLNHYTRLYEYYLHVASFHIRQTKNEQS